MPAAAAASRSHNLAPRPPQVSTAGTLLGELALEETPVPGLDAKVKIETGLASSGAVDTGSVTLRYKHDVVAAEAVADVVNGTVDASALFGYDAFVFGGSAKVNSNLDDATKGPELSQYSAALGYRGNNWSATLSTADKLDSVSLAMYQRVNRDTELALVSKLSLAKGKSASQRASIELGTKHQLDATAHIRAKVDSKGFISAMFEQQLSFATLTTSAGIDATKLETDNHRFGIALTFGQ